MAVVTGVFDVGDIQDQENTPTGLEDLNEAEPGSQQDIHQQDVDQEQGNTQEAVRITTEQEQVLFSPIESSSTMYSEYDSNQFLMENFNFSFTSLHQRTATPESYFCRICHQRSLSEPNLSPCYCRGTMGLIHKSCLERWLAASDSNSCELCHFNFTIKRQPKFGILKAIMTWLQSEECRMDRLHVVFDIIRLVGSIPLILFVNHLTAALFEIFHFDDAENCDFFSFLKNIESNLNISSVKDGFIVTGRLLTYFSVGFTSAMDIFAVGWVFSRIEEHYHMWHRWYRTQCIIDVVLPESSQEELEDK